MLRLTVVFIVIGLLSVACADDQSTPDPGGRHTDPDAALGQVTDRSSTLDASISTSPEQPDAGVRAQSEVTVDRGVPAGEPQTEPGPGEVKLWVSNQSFADDPVTVTISIDGVSVIEEDFRVEGQHNWIGFNVRRLQPGRHTITGSSSTGAEHTDIFTVSADEPRWLVLNYWYSREDSSGRYFTFAESDLPIAFD